MIRSILVATALAFGVASAAHAVPIKPSASPKLAVSSDLVEVGKKSYKGSKYYKKGGKYHRGKYSHRYKRAPKGWRSYSYRPYGWHGRGCIVVGPLWYCP
jgi:hypothetical protein